MSEDGFVAGADQGTYRIGGQAAAPDWVTITGWSRLREAVCLRLRHGDKLSL